MTKFCKMTVTVPIDDELPVQAVHEHLHRMLDERGTERIAVPRQQTEGAGEPELPGTPEPSARIHWTATEVCQAVERTPKAAHNVVAVRRRGAAG